MVYISVLVNISAATLVSGDKNITENGTYDVTSNKRVVVNVPASALASGSKNITSNGNNIDVTGLKTVNVNVSGGTYLGTGTSFNVKNYRSDYASLTANDFMCEAIGAVRTSPITSSLTPTERKAVNAYVDKENGPEAWGMQANSYLVKSYNASTGVLTAYYRLDIALVGYNGFSDPPAYTKTISVKAYCIK